MSDCNAGDPGSTPGSGISPGGRNGNSLQYSCLENSTDRGAWWATVHGVAELDTTEPLNNRTSVVLDVLCLIEIHISADVKLAVKYTNL